MAFKNSNLLNMHYSTYSIGTASTAFNDNKYYIGVFLDLKKAFDTVPHDRYTIKKTRKTGHYWNSTQLVH